MASSPTILLLKIKLTAFKASCVEVNARLPCRRSKISDRAWGGVVEDVFDFFERLLSSLGEQEEDMNEHGGTKHPKHNVDLPACWIVSLFQKNGYIFWDIRIFANAGGTKYAKAKLNAQLADVANATAFPRTRRGYSSGG